MADKPITSDGGMIAARVPLKDAIWRAAYPNGRAELLSVSNEEAAAREHLWSLAIAQIAERLWKKRRVLEFFQVVRQWDESWPKKPTFEAAEKAVNLCVARRDELHNEIIPHLDAVAEELQSACEDGEVLLWWKGERIDPRELSQFKITRYWRRTSGRTVVDFRLKDRSFRGQVQSAVREGVKVYKAPLKAWLLRKGRTDTADERKGREPRLVPVFEKDQRSWIKNQLNTNGGLRDINRVEWPAAKAHFQNKHVPRDTFRRQCREIVGAPLKPGPRGPRAKN